MRPFILLTLVAACGSPNTQPVPEATVASDSARVLVRRAVEQSSLADRAAIEAFRPALAAADSAPQCSLTRSRGSGATRVTARFSARDSSTSTVTLWFDSVGTLVRYSDSRGARSIRLPPNLSALQRDSAMRTGLAMQSMTFISFDFATDEARASNTRDGRAPETITGSVRELEHLPALGPPLTRIRRVRELCGV